MERRSQSSLTTSDGFPIWHPVGHQAMWSWILPPSSYLMSLVSLLHPHGHLFSSKLLFGPQVQVTMSFSRIGNPGGGRLGQDNEFSFGETEFKFQKVVHTGMQLRRGPELVIPVFGSTEMWSLWRRWYIRKNLELKEEEGQEQTIHLRDGWGNWNCEKRKEGRQRRWD